MSIQVPLLAQTEFSKQWHANLDVRLAAILRDQQHRAATPHMSDLWQRITTATEGGKRTRPFLVQLGYHAVRSTEEPRLVDIGCPFELLHTALVIHDDIIDQDFIRRGRPTVSAHYRDQALAQQKSKAAADQIGHTVALLAGDALLSTAIELVHTACQDLAHGQRIIEIFHEAIQQSAAGELDDVVYSADITTPDLDDVLRMHRLKTAAYSFEAPLVIGALVADASEDVIPRLAEFANQLGACYQIIDDVLGTFGHASTTGKPNDSDLREGKITVLIALAEGLNDTAPTVQAWREGRVSHHAMRALLIDHDIETEARALAAQCARRARVELTHLSIPEDARTTLECLIDDLLQRNT